MDTKTTIRNGSARIWDVFQQAWVTTPVSEVSDAILATLTDDERSRILRARAAASLGSARTPAKAAASRENGKRGGRPRTTPGTVNTETKRFAARVARVARYCKTPITGDTTLEDWLAEGYTYEGSAREVARQWDELSAE